MGKPENYVRESDAQAKPNHDEDNEWNYSPNNMCRRYPPFRFRYTLQIEDSIGEGGCQEGHLKIDTYHQGKPQGVKPMRKTIQVIFIVESTDSLMDCQFKRR